MKATVFLAGFSFCLLLLSTVTHAEEDYVSEYKEFCRENDKLMRLIVPTGEVDSVSLVAFCMGLRKDQILLMTKQTTRELADKKDRWFEGEVAVWMCLEIYLRKGGTFADLALEARSMKEPICWRWLLISVLGEVLVSNSLDKSGAVSAIATDTNRRSFVYLLKAIQLNKDESVDIRADACEVMADMLCSMFWSVVKFDPAFRNFNDSQGGKAKPTDFLAHGIKLSDNGGRQLGEIVKSIEEHRAILRETTRVGQADVLKNAVSRALMTYTRQIPREILDKGR